MYSVGRRGKAQNCVFEKKTLITTSGESCLSHLNAVLNFTFPDYMHMDRILLEKAVAESEETRRPRKRRRLAARSFQPRHTRDMSTFTPSNVLQRPQWRATRLGRLIEPVGPPLGVLKAQSSKSLVKEPRRQRRKKRAADCRLNTHHLHACAG